MTEPGATTFAKLLRQHLETGVIKPDDSVLVQFAGEFDQKVCAAVGLTNCNFANIAPESQSVGEFTEAAFMDAHKMPYADDSFDHVIGHSGLHHCSRPHEALHEMYRLARKTVLFVENQDSIMMRAATKAGVVTWHELAAVIDGDFKDGGVDGTGVPNFVYRWTRREVRKAVASYDPAYHVPLEIHAEWNLGTGRVASAVLQKKLHLSDENAEKTFLWGQKAFNKVFGRQGNIFAVTIRKDLKVLHAWMASPTEMERP
jgi:SAM-dependent methyltransferase